VKVWGRGEIHTEFWSGNLNEKKCVENLGIDERISYFYKEE